LASNSRYRRTFSVSPLHMEDNGQRRRQRCYGAPYGGR
jgi:hypothetical protein